MIKQILLAMKSQHQNLQQDHRFRHYNAQEANLNAKSAMPATKETLNQDNRIYYKSRSEALNRRVKSIIEQKKPIQDTRTNN